MQGRTRLIAAATTVATLGLSAPAMADTAYGLLASGTKLTTFDTATPNQQATAIDISGLATGEKVVGIDVRPANGVLYGLGVSGTQGRLLRINPATGAATLVGVLKDGTAAGADIAISGTSFDLDFNPAADRLRIVSDADQNLRVNPSNGVTAQAVPGTPGDGTLAFAAGDANAGDNPDVGHAAYTNSFAGTTATTLFNLDAGNDALVTQNPPNAGTLNTVGALGVDITNVGGFDIVPGTNRAIALLNTLGATPARRFYTVDLTTGAATATSGALGQADPLVDFALAPKDTVTFLGLATDANGGQQLFQFRSDDPGTVSGTVPVTGLPAGERLVGIDTRPRTGQVYGVSSTGKIFLIEPNSGVATAAPNNQIPVALDGTRFGVDFNPAADRLRIVSDNRQNLRINVDNAAAGTAMNGSPDAAFTAPTQKITEVAYTNNTSDTATTQIQYIDSTTNELLTAADANNPGVPTPLGTAAAGNVAGALQVDVTDRGGYDIVGPFNRRVGAFATAAEPNVYRLYTIGAEGGLSSEAKAIPTGTIAQPAGTVVDGLTAFTGSTVRFGAASTAVAENGGTATVTIVRENGADSAATVSYTTADGTGKAGTDYTATSGSVTFQPGETVKTVSVPVIDDAVAEGTKTFAVALTASTGGARISTPALTAVSILDDEIPASVGTGPGQTVTVTVPVLVPATAPFVFVRAATDEIRLSTLRSKGILVRLYCTQACEVSGNLTASSALAKRSGKNIATLKATKVSAGATRLVRLKLTSKARTALGRKSLRSATFKLPLKVKDPSGKTTNVTALTVRAFK
ncbi:DUF4394 domain-containing protein [Conexibacter sp. W3-3-2]|uniref:DUF4394 domain-containing protein n=1 Tax=Conexibacter sp. W3-3-2 TaxID=2675227 RepID=UPI0012B87F22|nr:DUF4394 domain-containing protein [Conexibacter sp. W3-3-2]MTD45041.1 DUF4394 domain-containing protein [Conexibacter sp. W3-3-2]